MFTEWVILQQVWPEPRYDGAEPVTLCPPLAQPGLGLVTEPDPGVVQAHEVTPGQQPRHGHLQPWHGGSVNIDDNNVLILCIGNSPLTVMFSIRVSELDWWPRVRHELCLGLEELLSLMPAALWPLSLVSVSPPRLSWVLTSDNPHFYQEQRKTQNMHSHLWHGSRGTDVNIIFDCKVLI